MTNKTKPARATTIEELETVLSHFFSEESTNRGLEFQPQPTDIIISPYAKCGTTWLQQITHGLRTRGNMDFEEITVVTPWIEIAHDMGWDLEAPHVAEPRVYKSHLDYYRIPKDAKYIVSFRHYYDAFVSFYRFFEGWYFEPDTIDLQTLMMWRYPRENMGDYGYWHHLASWWEQRDNENVLLLCYEDTKADLPAAIEKIAAFMGIDLDDDLREIVLRQSSRDFMLAHQEKFEEHLTHALGGKRANLPPPITHAKVTSGTKNEPRYQLSDAQKQYMDDIWHEQITAKFGFNTYEDLRREVSKL